MPPFEKPISIRTFADMVGVSPRTLQRWDKEGILKAHRGPTNRRYYTQSQLEEAMSHVSFRVEQVGEVFVDAGLVWIGDPCYFLPEEGDLTPRPVEKEVGNWQQFCEKIEKTPYPHRYNFGGLGVAVTSGMGDGIYPVFATFNKAGQVTSVTVQFLDEDEDGEEEE